MKAPPCPSCGWAPGKPGRPAKKIDLAEVERLRSVGLTTVTDIARAMKLAPQLLLSGAMAESVKEAFERGRVAAMQKALEQYELAIETSNGQIASLCIFKLKQFGWTDRARIDATIDVPEGARERLVEAVARLQEKWAAERATGEVGS
jgi:hypothetical protein